jgi:hypothetical protein
MMIIAAVDLSEPSSRTVDLANKIRRRAGAADCWARDHPDPILGWELTRGWNTNASPRLHSSSIQFAAD